MGRSMHYGVSEGMTRFCLGRPPHPLLAEEVLCHLCGTLAAGANLGVYQVQQLLGNGRSGNAYLAMHVRSRLPVVLKLFPPDPTTTGLWEAARREARAATALRHPSILPVFSCTTWQPQTGPATTRPLHELMTSYTGQETYLLTLRQYVPGTLQQFIAHAKQEASETGQTLLPRLVNLLEQAGSALSAAHAQGLVHGALSPGNIFIEQQEHLWIADFGLARLHPPLPPYVAPELYAACKTATQTGNMMPFWREVTAASDQYSLAILSQQILSSLLHPADYEYIQPILQCATNPQPAQRFASIDIFVHELVTQAAQRKRLPVSSAGAQIRGARPVSSPQAALSRARYSAAQAPQPPIVDYNLVTAAPLSSPSVVDDWEKLGGKLFTTRDYNGAVKAYRRALELDTNRASIWSALGDTYFALEHYGEALGAYEQATSLNPDDPLTWSSRGTALDALGRHQEAMECYERADQLNQ